MTTKSIRERIQEEEDLETPKKSIVAEPTNLKNTRSCYFCSTHHLLAKGVIGRLLGRNEFFCSLACKDKVLSPAGGASRARLFR